MTLGRIILAIGTAHFFKNRGEVVWRPGAGKLKSEPLGFMARVPFVRHVFQNRHGPVGNEQGAVEKHLLVPSP